MSEPTLTDLAVAVATLSGKIDGFALGFRSDIAALGTRMEEARNERTAFRADLHKENEALRSEITKLQLWRAWMTGGMAVLLGLAGTLGFFSLHPHLPP